MGGASLQYSICSLCSPSAACHCLESWRLYRVRFEQIVLGLCPVHAKGRTAVGCHDLAVALDWRCLFAVLHWWLLVAGVELVYLHMCMHL